MSGCNILFFDDRRKFLSYSVKNISLDCFSVVLVMEGDGIFDKLSKYSIRIEILRTKDERIKKEVWGLCLNDPAFIKGLFGVYK